MITVVRWFLRVGALALIAAGVVFMRWLDPCLTPGHVSVIFLACTFAGGLACISLFASFTLNRGQLKSPAQQQRVKRDDVLLCEQPHDKVFPIATSYCREQDVLLCVGHEHQHDCSLTHHEAPSMSLVRRRGAKAGVAFPRTKPFTKSGVVHHPDCAALLGAICDRDCATSKAEDVRLSQLHHGQL